MIGDSSEPLVQRVGGGVEIAVEQQPPLLREGACVHPLALAIGTMTSREISVHHTAPQVVN
jgi:hypothetical protein